MIGTNKGFIELICDNDGYFGDPIDGIKMKKLYRGWMAGVCITNFRSDYILRFGDFSLADVLIEKELQKEFEKKYGFAPMDIDWDNLIEAKTQEGTV